MAHIHEKIDFTVAIFVVHEEKILIIHHRKLNKWLPLGGHIELDEDPEIAALREAKEESGGEEVAGARRIYDAAHSLSIDDVHIVAGDDHGAFLASGERRDAAVCACVLERFIERTCFVQRPYLFFICEQNVNVASDEFAELRPVSRDAERVRQRQ